MTKKREPTTRQKIARLRRWAKALRSGRFKQGSFNLYNPNDNTYCCLGVACKITRLGDFKKNMYRISRRSRSSTFLPTEVCNYYGIDRYGEEVVRHNGEAASLVYANDSLVWSFKKIARQIDTYANRLDREAAKKKGARP